VTLGLIYVVTVLLSQQLLRGFTGGSDIAVARSTLLVVALFQPIRSRVQEFVDHRFYRARYDGPLLARCCIVVPCLRLGAAK
jgi:hypothetical protein